MMARPIPSALQSILDDEGLDPAFAAERLRLMRRRPLTGARSAAGRS